MDITECRSIAQFLSFLTAELHIFVAMVKVYFTQALQRFYPDLTSLESNSSSLPELLTDLDLNYPGISAYLVDDQGHLRQHVNIFLDDRMVSDRKKLSDSLEGVKELYIMQALSGG